MATWDEFDEKAKADRDEEEDNLGLVVTTVSDTKSDLDPDDVFKDFFELTKVS